MGRQETHEERCARELADDKLYKKMLMNPFPYAKESRLRTVPINGDYYSWFWLMAYYEARMAGVSCFQISEYYALQREYQAGLSLCSGCENHDHRSLDIDHRILHLAHVHRLAQNKLLRRKVKRTEPKPELVAA